jgi:hypothetical protein
VPEAAECWRRAGPWTCWASPRSYQRFIEEGLRERHREEYYDVKDQQFLGEDRFVENLKARADEEPEAPRLKKTAIPAFRSRKTARQAEMAARFGLTSTLRPRGRPRSPLNLFY